MLFFVVGKFGLFFFFVSIFCVYFRKVFHTMFFYIAEWGKKKKRNKNSRACFYIRSLKILCAHWNHRGYIFSCGRCIVLFFHAEPDVWTEEEGLFLCVSFLRTFFCPLDVATMAVAILQQVHAETRGCLSRCSPASARKRWQVKSVFFVFFFKLGEKV